MQKIDNVTEFYPSISSNWKSVAVEIYMWELDKIEECGAKVKWLSYIQSNPLRTKISDIYLKLVKNRNQHPNWNTIKY